MKRKHASDNRRRLNVGIIAAAINNCAPYGDPTAGGFTIGLRARLEASRRSAAKGQKSYANDAHPAG